MQDLHGTIIRIKSCRSSISNKRQLGYIVRELQVSVDQVLTCVTAVSDASSQSDAICKIYMAHFIKVVIKVSQQCQRRESNQMLSARFIWRNPLQLCQKLAPTHICSEIRTAFFNKFRVAFFITGHYRMENCTWEYTTKSQCCIVNRGTKCSNPEEEGILLKKMDHFPHKGYDRSQKLVGIR